MSDGKATTEAWVTLDSGARQDFDTGSVRDSRDGKGRYDLITPLGLARVAGVYERGAEKYADRNWEKGQPLSRYMDSALRHLYEVLEGRVDEDHAGHAAWNILAFMHTQEAIARGLLPAELDDMPTYMPVADDGQPSLFDTNDCACGGDCGCGL